MIAPPPLATAKQYFEEHFNQFGGIPATANRGKHLFYEELNGEEREILLHAAQRTIPDRNSTRAHSLAVLTAQAACEFSGLHGHECAFSQALADRNTRAELLVDCVPHVAQMHCVKQWLNLDDTHKHLEQGVYIPPASRESMARSGGRG